MTPKKRLLAAIVLWAILVGFFLLRYYFDESTRPCALGNVCGPEVDLAVRNDLWRYIAIGLFLLPLVLFALPGFRRTLMADDSESRQIVVPTLALVGAVVGAAILVVGEFLPLAQKTSGLESIQDNALVTQGLGWALFVVAILVVVAADRVRRESHRSTLILLGGLIAAGLLAYYIGSDLFRVAALDQRSGSPIPGTSERPRAGIGVYVMAAGIALIVLSGYAIWTARAVLGERGVTATVAVPDRGGAPSDSDAASKTCPDCAEIVREAANVCRYCGYRFSADTA